MQSLYKTLSAIVIVWLMVSGNILTADAKTRIMTSGSEANRLEVAHSSYHKTALKHNLGAISLEAIQTSLDTFYQVEINGYAKSYDIGRAQLPTKNELIEMPHGAEAKIVINNYDYEDFDLSDFGIMHQLMPSQPSYSKSENLNTVTFKYDANYYKTDYFFQEPLISIEPIGILRGVRVAHLKIAPLAYNPARNTLRVYKNICFHIIYENPQIAKTIDIKEKYYSPMFDAVHGQLINYQAPPQKGYLSTYPITYVIVSDPMFQSALQTFIDWKTKKGFNVIEAYTNNPQVGQSTTSIKSYLQSLYQSATPANPAPSYVLFVGDVAQIPAFSGTTGIHVTDLYYCEYDGGNDYLPDVYYGRFSANNLSELLPQIEKTLNYEQYTMSHQSFLDTVVLVAGVDSHWSTVHANGQINYAVDHYFNAAQQIYAHAYFYPASINAGSQMRQNIFRGVGFANYTAHCFANGWDNPSFNVSHINQMAEGKYGLIISNCCLPNRFNDPECFGEALLRAANKGAIGHVGASNNTYWDEDYWWSVGYTSSIIQNPTYQGTGLGAYDRLFNLHGEPFGERFVANGQINYAGNLAVESSNSNRKKYYWEVYHLMGDPSVMTYFSQPQPLQVNYQNAVFIGESQLVINTEPYAYAALSHNSNLLSAALADSNGVAVLHFTPFMAPDTADIVVTKQNRIPYQGELHIVDLQHQHDVALVQILEPQKNYQCTGLQISPQVVFRSFGLTTLNSLQINYKLNNGSLQTQQWTGTLNTLESDTVYLPSFTLFQGYHDIIVYTSQPNQQADDNPLNDTLKLSFIVDDKPVSAFFSTTDSVFCNAPASVSFINQSLNAHSYYWDFDDGESSSLVQPSHTFKKLGTYNVTLIADAGICGHDTFKLPYNIRVGLEPPIAFDAYSCSPDSLPLIADGYDNLHWFASTYDSLPIFIGDTFITPVIDTTTTYYVQGLVNNQVQHVGKYDNTGSGGFFGSNLHWHYLIFNCYEPTILKSVKVYANNAGTRTILLRDAYENIIDSVDVFIPQGESRIQLNFDIPVGNDLQLVGAGNVSLYRNDNNAATYPYELHGLITITESSASLAPYNIQGNYYYFYNWEVRKKDCKSIFKPVTAYVLDTPQSQFSYQKSSYAVTFTNTSSYAINCLWDFGDGNFSTAHSPTHYYNGPGNYDVWLYIDNICGLDSSKKTIELQGLPPEVHFTANSTNIVTGDTVKFSDLSLFQPHTWHWIFEEGSPPVSYVQNPEVVYHNPGIFYVTLIADNDYGSGYAHKNQYVYVQTTSLDEKKPNTFVHIYPNPLKEKKLHISFNINADIAHIDIFNTYGARIKSFYVKKHESSQTLKLHDLPSGIYFLRFSDTEQVQNFKFIIP